MSKSASRFSYEVVDGKVKGAFNVYQATNGKIYLLMGTGYTALAEQQIKDLGIDVYVLIDFDYELYKKAYTS
uniref:Uncharacterized protein n=1 Tax=Clostridium botulinum TaxID=1491 RepID=A0A077K2M4_CLOBO|nr:hypothetical protein [Clostridium botulinum]BAP25747.1 hypothetical protein [Clostridium botulinum]